MQLNKTIALIGMMGAGKTSVGRCLAEMISVPFRDSDDEIVAAAGMPIPEIFKTYGEAEFRGVERRVIARVIREQPCVLSTGGGAFMQEPVRDDISDVAVSVWLDVDVDILWKRVQDKPGRPLLDTPDPYGTLSDLVTTRGPTYAKANVIVRSNPDDSHESVAKDIIRGIIAHDKNNPENPVFQKGPDL